MCDCGEQKNQSFTETSKNMFCETIEGERTATSVEEGRHWLSKREMVVFFLVQKSVF